MKTIVKALALMIGLVSILSVLSTQVATSAEKASQALWTESLSVATTRATQEGKPILANFTGSDWCGWCIRLDREVFSTPEFATWAEKHVVLLKVDFPQARALSAETVRQNDALAAKYRVEGFPTIVFLKADGTVIGQTGYVPGGAATWIAEANRLLK